MRDDFLPHFLVLLLGLFGAAALFVYFEHNILAQIIVAAGGCIYYVAWGIIHHAVRGRLNKLIAVEYILVGGLVFLVLLTTLTLL